MSGLLVQRLADLNLIRDPASAGTKTLVISRHRKATKKYFSADDVVLHRRGTLQRRSSTDGTKTNLGSIDVVLHRRGRSLLTNTFAREAWDGDPNRKRTTTLFTAKYGKNGINVQNINGIHLPSPGNTVNLSYKKCMKMSGSQVNGIVNTLHDLTSDEQTNGLSDEDQPSDMRSPSVSFDHFVSPVNSGLSFREVTSSDINWTQNSSESESQDHSLSDTDIENSTDKSSEDVSMKTEPEDSNSMSYSLLTEVNNNACTPPRNGDSDTFSDSSDNDCSDKPLSIERTRVGDDDSGVFDRPLSDGGDSSSDNNGLTLSNSSVTILRTSKKNGSYSFRERTVGKAVNIGGGYRKCRLLERSQDFVAPYANEPNSSTEEDNCTLQRT